MRILPADRKRLVDLQILAGFDAPAAQDALTRVVTVKRITTVDSIRFRFKRIALMFHTEQFRRVVDRAVSVVVVAHGAVELVIPQNAVECLGARRSRSLAGCPDGHSRGYDCGAGSSELAVDVDDAGIAGLNRTQLWVIANLRQ